MLPYDGIGGAEAAARSMAEAPAEDLDFRLSFLFPAVSSTRQRLATFRPMAFVKACRALVREKPDVLVVSLWRSCVVGAMVKLLRPRTRLAVMIHNSIDAHAADWLSTRLAMALADAVWADSEASMRLRFRRAPRAPVTVIPFLTHHLTAGEGDPGAGDPVPTFAFWGRLAGQKNLFRALELFRAVHRVHRGARFSVIGPDCGERSKLEAWCAHAGLSQAVHFIGPLSSEAIREVARDHCFYLQTSDYEGMAMSVVEAMQLGLVPVVTPVGEIRAYCRDGENAIVVGDVGAAAADVLRVLDDPARWRALRRQALETWRGAPLYRDAVAAACRRLSPACVR